MGSVTRSALCVSVPAFGPTDQEPDIATPQPLPFASGLTKDMVSALTELGYHCTVPPDGLSAEELGARVEKYLSDTKNGSDVRIVHVISHGVVPEKVGKLHVLGGDGRFAPATQVERWLELVEGYGDAPPTLFLLDICHAGQAVILPWQADLAAGDIRAYVLAASEAGRPAYDGRFTEAIVAALREVARGEPDIAPSFPHVALTTVVSGIQLRMRAAGHPQRVRGTALDFSYEAPNHPFFPNRRYDPDAGTDGVDEGLGDLVNLIDTDHFTERAASHGVFGTRLRWGHFRGRRGPLEDLSRWIDEPSAALGTYALLRVVTGRPGTGKSALLGVLVCSAHRDLRDRTDELLHHLPKRPSRNEHLAAVHARQRTIRQIVDSLRRQLGLPGDSSPDPTQTFITAVVHLGGRPVIVIDALDEAAQPRELTEGLLLPLAAAGICRLLVGTRDEPAFADLLGAARRGGGVLDLDDEPRAETRDAVREYLDGALAQQSPYSSNTHAPGREAYATAVAGTLLPSGTSQETPGWGAFLVAALFTYYRVVGDGIPADPGSAALLGGHVPLALPEVMELDLGHRRDNPWARPVLAALAYARGIGLPEHLLAATAPIFHPLGHDGRALSPDDLNSALGEVRFYLRHAPDRHGVIHYRLFHQGLADHLRNHPILPPQGQVTP